MCGRRKLEKEYPELVNWGDIDFGLLKKISKQVPKNIIIQFFNNGEGLLYPRFGEAVRLFDKQIKCLNTNGKLLLEKADEIIDNLDTLTISVIENDPEGNQQYEGVKKFLEIKGKRNPRLIYRLLGDVGIINGPDGRVSHDEEAKKRWYKLPGLIATRIIHSPMGSFNYTKKVTVPEHGICLDLLNHMAIDRFGNVSLCVRFDPEKKLVIGDAAKEKLFNIWNSKKRQDIIKLHIEGRRCEIPGCDKCEFYGCPTGS